jgi:hypothetical protein
MEALATSGRYANEAGMNRLFGSVRAFAVLAFVMAALGCEKSLVVPGLFSYSIQDWNAASRQHNRKGSWPQLRRNSDGSRLYCHDWDDGTVRVLSRGSRSELVRSPAKLSYLNRARSLMNG